MKFILKKQDGSVDYIHLILEGLVASTGRPIS